MSDNNLSRICLYKCMGRHKSCMNNSWIIQNPKYHKYRIPFFAVLASSLSSPGIGYLGHKMRVCLTIGLVYARIWHPSMTENRNFSTIHQKKVQRNDLLRAGITCNSRISKLHTWEKSCLAFSIYELIYLASDV